DKEIIVEDQPYADYASPTALSLWYVTDSDPEEDSKDGLVDYLADGGDDDDDDDSSDDDEEDEEEHLALSDSIVAPVVDHVPSFEEIAPMPFPLEAEVDRSLTISTPSLSPLISLLPPSAEERLARAAMGRLRASSPSTHHPLHPSPPLPPLPSPPLLPLPSLPLPPLPTSLFIPLPVDHREDIPEAELPPHKRLCLSALTSRFEVRESSTGAARPTRDLAEAIEEVAPTNLKGVNAKVTKLAEVQEEDTQDLYCLETVMLMEQEALVSRKAWAQSVGLSSARQLLAALGQIQALQARDLTHVDDLEGADSCAYNNMPPKRTAAAVRVVIAVARSAVAAPMTTAAVKKLIEARVSVEHTNHETLRNSINGHGDRSHNSNTGIRGTVRTSHGISVPYQQLCCGEPSKFATCTFLRNALTWWNSHMKIVTQDVVYAMD
ncbi:hypothetical protein Tco_1073374, partial [Tanacetum coccineum]